MGWWRRSAAALAVAAFAPWLAGAGGSLANFTVHPQPRPVPTVEFAGPDGARLTLDAFNGRVVLLNLWATWCAPCREEMPSLDRLQAIMGGRDFAVVAVSVDRGDPAKPAAFLAEIGAKHLALYHDPSMKIARTLGLPGLPGTLLIDREGRELGRLLGPAEWDSPAALALIRRLMGSTAPGAART
ncbi:MAG: TlpA family protein disulfide reductase [Alphaproteobacteria bacterium]|nr:TlpA family protein disulfide reductase [Alphaproteobacteria bacterium]